MIMTFDLRFSLNIRTYSIIHMYLQHTEYKPVRLEIERLIIYSKYIHYAYVCMYLPSVSVIQSSSYVPNYVIFNTTYTNIEWYCLLALNVHKSFHSPFKDVYAGPKRKNLAFSFLN
jgi:hypothetical protein